MNWNLLVEILSCDIGESFELEVYNSLLTYYLHAHAVEKKRKILKPQLFTVVVH